MSKIFALIISTLISVSSLALADESQLDRGMKAIHSLTGCYLVDYSFTETDGIKPGYVRNDKVYDVNDNKSVKEWIYAEDVSPTRVRIQHVIFMADLDGHVVDGSMLKHTGEDWNYGASYMYNFTGPSHWEVKDLKATPDQWTQYITNLDDGLRYACSAPFKVTNGYPEWVCSTYAPIPGRETRDEGRKDYNTLQRTSRLVAYNTSWLLREDNIKTIDDGHGGKTPLAHELGKNWYVRLPDTECTAAQKYIKPRAAFWSLERQVWDEVLIGDRPFVEVQPPGSSPRYQKMWDIEEKYTVQDIKDPAVRKNAESDILKLIQDYRGQ